MVQGNLHVHKVEKQSMGKEGTDGCKRTASMTVEEDEDELQTAWKYRDKGVGSWFR